MAGAQGRRVWVGGAFSHVAGARGLTLAVLQGPIPPHRPMRQKGLIQFHEYDMTSMIRGIFTRHIPGNYFSQSGMHQYVLANNFDMFYECIFINILANHLTKSTNQFFSLSTTE